MKSGRMDRQITIQGRDAGESVIGSPVNTWTNVATVWAEVQPVRGDEVVKLGKETASEMAKFIIRYRSDVSQTNRISYNSKIYNIQYVREFGRAEGLEILGVLSK